MTIENPINSLHQAISFSARDWGINATDAWIYGIIVGWDDESLFEISRKFGWSISGDDERLKRLHEKYERIKVKIKCQR